MFVMGSRKRQPESGYLILAALSVDDTAALRDGDDLFIDEDWFSAHNGAFPYRVIRLTRTKHPCMKYKVRGPQDAPRLIIGLPEEALSACHSMKFAARLSCADGCCIISQLDGMTNADAACVREFQTIADTDPDVLCIDTMAQTYVCARPSSN